MTAGGKDRAPAKFLQSDTVAEGLLSHGNRGFVDTDVDSDEALGESSKRINRLFICIISKASK
jgi:hypothetical protein